MRTVSGKVISSKPVSLSKAAKILSEFVGYENGASDAVSVYLKRAAEAFNSLVRFHKELKNPHSIRKHRHQSSQVKNEENPDAGEVTILESKAKRQKNSDFEVKIEETLEIEHKRDEVDEGKDEKDKRKYKKNRKETIKIEQIHDVVGEGREKKNYSEEKVKIEEATEIVQVTPDQVGEKRKKKKHKKEKVKNEEPIKIEQSIVRDTGEKETQVLDEGGKGKKSKQESVEIEQNVNEIEEGSVKKREKKKRKKRDGEDPGESVEFEERKSRDVDGGKTIDLAEQSGKKERKRRKTEGAN